ncbi:hypothetical protein KDAU_50010 [Dictyobacter aurantiacus]|uniref:Uncharacterized protein n=1 Tax=Dictyobacter aurantiacus TaxID=1936993 RepID=A0A401ZLH1_9CHLR|nr:hypothetical protein KDAU_50010 [Dictyobacter aurantiacus]
MLTNEEHEICILKKVFVSRHPNHFSHSSSNISVVDDPFFTIDWSAWRLLQWGDKEITLPFRWLYCLFLAPGRKKERLPH